MTRPFHIHVHASSSQEPLNSVIKRVGDQDLPVLVSFFPREPFLSSFEETADRLRQLPRLFFEPDGSFAWNRADSPAGQSVAECLEGVLYDRDSRVQYCQLKGHCSRDMLARFLAALKGQTPATIVQLAEEGVFVEEREFLRWIE